MQVERPAPLLDALHGRVVTLPQKTWKSFPGAESKPAERRPLYLLCRQRLTQRKLNGEPLLVAIDNGTYDPAAGRARRYMLNLPWCDREPLCAAL